MAAANLGSGAMMESDARKYLTDKRIMPLFEKLCASLVVNQPDNPQKFLIAQLERLQKGEDVLGVPRSRASVHAASGESDAEAAPDRGTPREDTPEDDGVKKLVADMFTSENNSLVKQHLTQDIYDQLSGLQSKEVGYTIDDAIKTAVDNQDSGVGIYAGDEDSYHIFAPIFDKVIESYHGGYKPSDKHKSDMNSDKLVAPEVRFDDYVISTRIRVGRNVSDYGLSPGIPQEQRKELEELVVKALSKLEGELSGTYYPLQGMDEETRQKLVDDHFLFKKGDRFLESCGANRDWPEGRGIYHNNKKTFLVWVNEEDNLRIISMEQGADFVGVFRRLAAGIKAIEEVLGGEGKSYQFNDHHGFIHSCPSNLGTGMRASVHIKLPKLSTDVEKFYARCAELKLQPRGIHGEHSETADGIYDLSNKHRIGYTEVELVQTMIDGVQQLIKEEAELAGVEFPTMQGGSKQVAEMFTAENTSLVKQHLTQEIYDELKGVKSKEVGYTIDDAIKTAIDNQDSGVGIYAGDEDSYHVFAPIFDKVIETYHGGYKPTDEHKSDMDPANLEAPEEKFDDYVISTRIRVGRNVTGYGLSPGIPRKQRKELEELVAKALSKLEGNLAGTYYPLQGMDEETRQKLVDDHFLFKKGDRFLESCGANRDWPEGRGIYHNDQKTFLVWVNEEDNLRIISMEQGADFVGVFTRLAAGIKAIEEVLGAEGKSYQFNDHHGFIHSCPSNLGTGMRASVHIKLPTLSADVEKFKARCAELKLQPRGIHGEHSETADGIYDLSNKHRIGYTEVELVQAMIDGVQQLIKEEAALAGGDSDIESGSDSKQISEMFTAENNSLVKQHLTQEIYDELKGLKSKEVGYTIDDAIRTAVDNQDSGVGIYAGDEDSYHVFAPIFDKVIETYHGGYKPDDKHKSDMDPENLKAPEEKFDDYVISTRIRAGRNITGYGLSPGIPQEQRKELEELVAEALSKLEGELSGTYYPLQGMDEETRQKLVDDHFLFKKGDRFLESCGANRDWPEGRGIYHNDQKTFLVWVNEEDNLRIISMEQGADFVGVFKRLAAGIKAIEEVLTADGKGYQFNDHHGFIHSCPSNLGTGMRASVHIKLPKLSVDLEKFRARCAELKLQPRGIHGEHSETTNGVYDLSNKHRIGYTEVELVQTMIDGVQQLIKEEAACE